MAIDPRDKARWEQRQKDEMRDAAENAKPFTSMAEWQAHYLPNSKPEIEELPQLATSSAVVLDDERAALQSIIDAGRNAEPKHVGGIGKNTVYLTPEMYAALARAASPRPVAQTERALTGNELKLIACAADCISEAVRWEQDGFDTPPMPATEWDYNADQLAYALRALLTTPLQSEGLRKDAERYRMIRDFGKDGVDIRPPCVHVHACMYSHPAGAIPVTRAITGIELDAAIDAALAKQQDQS